MGKFYSTFRSLARLARPQSPAKVVIKTLGAGGAFAQSSGVRRYAGPIPVRPTEAPTR
jgi:hypothetical protein